MAFKFKISLGGGGGAGDIEAVIAGGGLTGGGLSGPVTLNAAFGTIAGTVFEGDDGAAAAADATQALADAAAAQANIDAHEALTNNPHAVTAAQAGAMVNPMTALNDVILGGASGVPGRLAGPTRRGHVLRAADHSLNPDWRYANEMWHTFEFLDHFRVAPQPTGWQMWTSTASGTGTGATATTGFVTSQAIGVVGLPTGTAGLGRTAFHQNVLMAALGGGETYNEWRARPVNLSDATNRYFVTIGMHDGTGAGEPTDGVYFRYTDNVNSGNWQAICRSGGTETVINTAVPVTTDWARLGVLVRDTTSVEFFIDGVSAGVTTTNIPGATQFLGEAAKIEQTVGTTNRVLALDYCYTQWGFTG